jgi:uncharacterized phage protein (TIGR01671 family)
MREIKFRAWEIDEKRWLDKDELFLSVLKGELSGWQNSGKWRLLQFTGISDVDGSEIYEGDILKWSSYVGEVKYKGDVCQFLIHDKKYPQEYDRGWRLVDSGNKIIGNIYENPVS